MVKVYQRRQVDELILLDMDATKENRPPDFELIAEITSEFFSPITCGGGIQTIEHMRVLLRCGADKVAINTMGKDRDFIRKAATKFGSQAIVVSVDHGPATGVDEVTCTIAERSGAGEILLTSKERDGTMSGYDLLNIERICEQVDIPVVANGGCGSYEDMLEALRAGAHAVAAASIFQFTQQTPLEASRFLNDRGIPTRLVA